MLISSQTWEFFYAENMTEIFRKPDNNPWEALARVTGEQSTARLDGFVYGLHALYAIIYRGQAIKRVDFWNQETISRLSVLFNQELPGVDIPLETIRQFLLVHGGPDGHAAGVTSECTGITDTWEPSDDELALAQRILDQL